MAANTGKLSRENNVTTTEQQPASTRLPAYRPPEGQRSREVLRGLASVLAVLAIVVAVPVGLLLALGSPIPTTLPDRSVLTSELDPMAVLRILSVIVWLAWAHFVVCFVVEWRSERRGVGLPSHVPLGGGSQAVARRLVAAILLLAGVAVLAAPFAHGGADVGRPAAVAAASRTQSVAAGTANATAATRSAATVHPHARTPAAPAGATIFYDVSPPEGRHHDSLWDIADRYLGDGRRYKEIFELNSGRDQPDGRRLDQARLIRPGWVLVMPADAAGPGLRREQPPALATLPGNDGGGALRAEHGATSDGTGDGTGASTAGETVATDSATTGAESPWRGALGASLVAAGLLAALRRTRGAAAVEPDLTGTEEALRLAADEVGAAFLDRALRGLVVLSAGNDQAMPEVYAACLGREQLILSVSPPREDAPAPWVSSDNGRAWTISRGDAEDVEVPADVLAPYPGLACFGDQDAWRMLLDLESAPGVVSLGGDDVSARAVAASVAVELATNRWSDTVMVTMVGFGDALDGLAPGRLRHADTLDGVLADVEERLARQSHGSASDAVLRGRGQRPDRALWAPEFIVLSAPPSPQELSALAALTADGRRTCGVLTVGDVPGARWRFVVSKNGLLDTGVLGLKLQAQLLPVESYRSLVPLFSTAAIAASSAQLPGNDGAPAPLPPVLLHGPAARQVPARHLDLDADLPVEVQLLGALDVDAPGPLEAERRELATELVALLALNPEGVHPNVISSALWPRGVADPVRDATLAHAQGWLGRDSAGRPRLRQDGKGRWVLDEDVRCDWQVFHALATRADETDDPSHAEELRAQALTLVIGPAFEGLPSGRYAWLARIGSERTMRSVVVTTAHRLAEQRRSRGDLWGAQQAARSGLRLLPEAELLWRDLLGAIADSGDRAELQACAEELYATLGHRRVPAAHAETDTLVDALLPGFRRRVA
jgi:LysM domain/Bacterial transcriptional activator domain